MKVNAIGPKDARIVIVGEAPGAEEERIGKPFVGAAGRLLDRCLAKAGINRAHCFITNVLDERPPGNNFKAVSAAKVAEGIARVRTEINEVNPNLVIAVGANALKALTGLAKITDWRGSVILSDDGYKLIPIVHPAAALRESLFTSLIEFDLQKAAKEQHNPDINSKERIVHKVRTESELEQFFAAFDGDEKDVVAFDIELDKDKRIDIIGFAWKACEGWSIDITALSVPSITKLFKLTLLNPNVAFIGHNVSFDVTVLKETLDIDVTNVVGDTMLMHHLCYADFPKSLGFLESIYTDVPFHKDTIKQDKMRYNAFDVMVTYECYHAIKAELIEAGLWNFYQRQIHSLFPVVVNMQCKGIKIDTAKREMAREKLTSDIEVIQQSLNDAVGRKLNPNSHKQLKHYFYTEQGYKPVINRSTGSITCNEQALEQLNAQKPSPIIDAVLELRRLRKILNTYIEMPLDSDGRVRSSYNIAGTVTGRFSSSQNWRGTGGNLQNIPKGIVKELFVPDEGYTLVEMDLSQAEARVVAALADETTLLNLFNSGGDVHTENAIRIFGRVDPELRTLAKRLVHAANYKIGPRTFGYVAKCSQSDAKRLLESYYRAFPKIRMWHLQVQQQIRTAGYLETPMGRKKWFYGRQDDGLIRQAIAFVPQSTVGDLLNAIMLKAWNAGIEPLLQVHDSFVWQTMNVAEDIAKVKEIAQIELQVGRHKLIIPAEFKQGRNWNEMREYNA